MRTKPSKEIVETRVVKRFHNLHEPVISLIQALQDMIPEGEVLGSRVEFTQVKGHVRVAYGHKPVELVIDDGNQKFTLKIESSQTKHKSE